MTKRGKGTKLMVVADGKGIPLGVHLASATPNEVTLIETTLNQVAVPRKGRGRPRKNPPRLIYDRAADSDALRSRLAQTMDRPDLSASAEPYETETTGRTQAATVQAPLEN